MATVPQFTAPRSHSLLRGCLVFLAILITARFILELAGVPATTTRYFSSSTGLFLAGIFVGAVAPLRRVHRPVQLVMPAIILSAWTGGRVVLFTIISAVFRLERSHFAEPEDYGNWAHLGRHLGGHLLELAIFAVIALILMVVP